MGPAPPPGLKAEETDAWTGWATFGDREVVREAAAKGLHVKLAHRFIAKRRNWDLAEAERWFEAEVRVWALQLLLLRQKFKAIHILSNINLDPIEELKETLMNVKDTKLRDFLAEHLMSTGKLDMDVQNHWILLQQLEKTDISEFQEIKPIEMSVKDIIKCDVEWKVNLATFLFFTSFEKSLSPFLNPKEAWRYLLCKNDTLLLHDWIHVYFSGSKTGFKPATLNVSSDVSETLYDTFLTWPITGVMISEVNTLPALEFTKDFIYNQLSCYGIFTDTDRNDVKMVLSRFVNMTNLLDIKSILEQPGASLNHDTFIKLLAAYCLKNNVLNVLFAYLKNYELSDAVVESIQSKELSVWISIKHMLADATNVNIRRCIFTTCQFLMDTDLHSYFSQNVFQFLSLVLFDESINLQTFFSAPNDYTIMDVTFNGAFLQKIFAKLPFVEHILNKQMTEPFKQDITLYQLLTNYQQLDMSQIFYFRYGAAKNSPGTFPHFSSAHLSQIYGHREKLTFTYYLKLARPSIASKVFTVENFRKYGKVTNKMKRIAANLAHSIALAHFQDTEVTSACIAFTEMIGVDSDIVRVHANVARVVCKQYAEEDVKSMFLNVEENKRALMAALEENLLDHSVTAGVCLENLHDILMDWDVAFKFAQLHGLEYPEKLLRHCLENNHWLIFLYFTQYHMYPIEQVLNLAPKFKCDKLSAHISHAIAFDFKSPDGDKSPKAKKESRRNKITKSTDSSGPGTFSHTSGESVFLDTPADYYVQNSDLIYVLCRCHKQEDVYSALLSATMEYQNPIFSVLATYYESKITVLSWLYWICASAELVCMYPPIHVRNIPTDTVSGILEAAIKTNYIATVAESFQIFFPENPLSALTLFLSEYLINFDDTSAAEHLHKFQTMLNEMEFINSLSETESINELIMDRIWICKIAVNLTKFTLAYGFKSSYHQERFVAFLFEENFEHDLFTECPDFAYLRNLMRPLSDVKVALNMAAILNLPSCNLGKEQDLWRCVDELIQLNEFDIARSLCKLENLSTDKVILAKWKHAFPSRRNIQEFWKCCDNELRTSEVHSRLASQFFIETVDLTEDKLEKYIVLKLACNWIRKCDIDDTDIQNIELEMWWLYLLIDDWRDFNNEFGEEPFLKYVSSEIRRQARTEMIKVTRNLNNDKLKANFNDLIGELLDKGQLKQAIRLEHMFNYQTDHTLLILTCMKLAEGELSPYNLSPKHRLLLEGIGGHHRKRTLGSARFSVGSTDNISVASSVKESVELVTNVSDFQAVLEALVNKVTRGRRLALRILCCSRISQATSRLYPRILMNYDASALLKITLTGDFDYKLEVAHDIMFAHNWSSYQIRDFLCAELVSAISKNVMSDSMSVESICLWGSPLDTKIHVVLDLCSEPSLLGIALLEHVDTPLAAATKPALNLAVELLIRAHDCFTADCNMEGISKVLRHTRSLVAKLARLQAWRSLIRILTGINRYTEMDYVFQILEENELFEWLLGQGTARATGLCRATMDYLRRKCPDRRDLARPAALRWGLHDAAAELWENEARESLTNLVSVAQLEMQNMGREPGPFGLSELSLADAATKKSLESALTLLTDASQHYLIADQYNSAKRTTRLAELVALQLGLLAAAAPETTAVCVFELTEDQFTYLVTQQVTFPQASILQSAYDYACDWATALYTRCVVQGNADTYLIAFLSSMPMTDILAKDVIRKYVLDRKISTGQPTPLGIRAILEAVRSPSVKYRLASELGLKDVVHGLLEGTSSQYLKDTVWKTGCPAPNS